MNQTYGKKTVLITGGTRGIGKSTAYEFAKNNYNIIINYVKSTDLAVKICQDIMDKYNVKAIFIQADISNEEEVMNMITKINNEFETIDCLINNAGIAIDSTLEDKNVDNFRKILNVNLIGPFLTMKHIGKIMLKQGYGSIVNVSSNNAIDSYYPYAMDYDASKSGLITLTHDFAIEFAPYIRVNCIAPGWTNTQMNKELDNDYISEECKHILLNRFAEPEEIAEAIYFAATATYLNDSIIKIDGGRI